MISGPKRVLMYPDHKHEDLPGHGDSVFAFLSPALIGSTTRGISRSRQSQVAA
jgi:hypothetical protein